VIRFKNLRRNAERAIAQAVGAGGFFAEAFFFVGFVFLIGTREEKTGLLQREREQFAVRCRAVVEFAKSSDLIRIRLDFFGKQRCC
jgi:hypothetical protein